MSRQKSQFPFSANFRRFPPGLVVRLNRIAAALARIDAGTIWPSAAEQLRFSAKVGTVHYSNLIEGNELPVLEAERAARRQLDSDTKAKVELVNYVDALDLIDRLHDEGRNALEPTPELLKRIHYETTKGLGSDDDPHFKHHHEGAWRDGVARVVDRVTGRVMFEAPPAAEVDARVAGLSSWILRQERDLEHSPPFVIAGAAHYGVTEIHPFADGNGRVARLFTVALLLRYGALPGRLFSFEGYYGRDKEAYYAALRSVRLNTLNMEVWLEYFLEGLAAEYERVAIKIDELAALGRAASNARVQLNQNQQTALTSLHLQGLREFSRAEYEQAAEVSKATATRDLMLLVGGGVLRRVGEGPASRYRFVQARQPGPASAGVGRSKSWTDSRIESELREFVGTRTTFPTVAEFRRRESIGLYAAVTRNGGTAKWSRRLGLTPPHRGRRTAAP